ncbi:MAG: hypothetical protein Gaeavirus28_1, partial [Gaeavirus sp.]
MNSDPVYNLEYVFNQVKDIGRLVQTIRIDRKSVIFGDKLWVILNKILSSSEINSDLKTELGNYVFNNQVLDAVERRIDSLKTLDINAYPDYYMNNIIKMYLQSDAAQVNLLTLLHMALDIGELEYILSKYTTNNIAPCYIPKIYDDNLFFKIFDMIFQIGSKFKAKYKMNIPESQKLFPQLIIKYITNLFTTYGSNLIIQMGKFKINKDQIKLFFDTVMGDDLTTELYNITANDTYEERIYKVIYGYLRDDYDTNQDNPAFEYILSITYKIYFDLLDLYSFNKNYIPIDTFISLYFYMGAFHNSLVNVGETVAPSLFRELISYDINSKNKLLNTKAYLTTNDLVPNEDIVNLLNAAYDKINITQFEPSQNSIKIIPDHIKYIPAEITQLYCILKPKLSTDVDTVINKINEINIILSNPNPANNAADSLFAQLSSTIKLDDTPSVTSLITSQNDLDILGID